MSDEQKSENKARMANHYIEQYKIRAQSSLDAPSGSAREAALLLEIASKCHALAAELALGMELTKARYWQEKAEHAEALADKLAKKAPNNELMGGASRSL